MVSVRGKRGKGDKYHNNSYIIDFVIHFFNSRVLFKLFSERKKHSLEAGRSAAGPSAFMYL
jgi:hypothetical protein